MASWLNLGIAICVTATAGMIFQHDYVLPPAPSAQPVVAPIPNSPYTYHATSPTPELIQPKNSEPEDVAANEQRHSVFVYNAPVDFDKAVAAQAAKPPTKPNHISEVRGFSQDSYNVFTSYEVSLPQNLNQGFSTTSGTNASEGNSPSLATRHPLPAQPGLRPGTTSKSTLNNNAVSPPVPFQP